MFEHTTCSFTKRCGASSTIFRSSPRFCSSIRVRLHRSDYGDMLGLVPYPRGDVHVEVVPGHHLPRRFPVRFGGAQHHHDDHSEDQARDQQLLQAHRRPPDSHLRIKQSTKALAYISDEVFGTPLYVVSASC